MKKSTNIIYAIIASTVFVTVSGLAFSQNGIINVSAERNNDEYTLVLDKNNQVGADNSVLTSSENKIYFGHKGNVTFNPSNAWATLVDDGSGEIEIFNTTEIKGMTSITINSDYSYLSFYYGGNVNGKIGYTNYVEFESSSINYSFPEGSEPSYFKIVGCRNNDSIIIEDITIHYSCIESQYVPTREELFTYTSINNGTEYRIDGYKTVSYIALGDEVTDLVIPSSINGKPVTQIGEGAFKSKINLKTITLPSSIKRIEYMAFAYNSEVEKVTLLGEPEYIDDYAFFMCGGLD